MNLSRTQQQTAMLGQLLKTAGGRQKLAASLGPSLRRRRDYMSIARKALMVETLPDGALPIYDKEFDVSGSVNTDLQGGSFVEAFVVGEEGGDIVSVTKPKRVTVPTFEIVSNPMIPITQIKERRFDLVARALNLAKAEVGAQEDAYVFQLFDGVAVAANAAAGSNVNDYVYNIDQTITAPVSVSQMADSFAQVTRHDLSIAYVFFNPRDYADLLKWTDANIDRETQRKLLKTGVMGYLWGATLLQSRKIGYGTFYVLADAEFLGVIPERIPLTVMSADRPDLRQIGFSIFENLGFLVFNPSGVQRVLITRGATTGTGSGVGTSDR
jgi:hypothetical protein